MLFTVIFVLISFFSEGTLLSTLLSNIAITIVVFVIAIAVMCTLSCTSLHRKVPINYILLGVFTLCEAWLAGSASIQYNWVVVVEAASLTASVSVAISLYAITTKTDYTIYAPMIFITCIVFMVAGMFAYYIGPTASLIWCVVGVLLFSFYLLIETQQIVGGQNKRFKISEDDYILASMVLYIDIMNIFMFAL